MEEEKKLTYRVKPGFTHGVGKQYKAGDEVELTKAEAAGFLDKLELATRKSKPAADVEAEPLSLQEAIASATDEELADALGVDAKKLAEFRGGKGSRTTSKLVVTSSDKPLTSNDVATTAKGATAKVEKHLEAETGKEFAKVSDEPPTLVETDKPVDGKLGNSPGQ